MKIQSLCLVVVTSLLLACAVQSCAAVATVVSAPIVVMYALATPRAPTLDTPETPELLAQVHGSVVVADGQGHLLVAALPGGELRELPTHGTAVAASAIDGQGRVVYVGRTIPWTKPVFGLGADRFELRVRSLATGEERTLTDWREQHGYLGDDGIRIAGGRVFCSDPAGRPRVFDLNTQQELDLSWWDGRIQGKRLSADGSRLIGRTDSPVWDRIGRLLQGNVAVDLATQQIVAAASDEPDYRPPGIDLDGNYVSIAGSGGSTQGIQEHLPGCTGPWNFISDRLAIYEGLASPASHPQSWVGFRWPNFERSIRLRDVESKQTVTIVPRFKLGSWAYSSNPPPWAP